MINLITRCGRRSVDQIVEEDLNEDGIPTIPVDESPIILTLGVSNVIIKGESITFNPRVSLPTPQTIKFTAGTYVIKGSITFTPTNAPVRLLGISLQPFSGLIVNDFSLSPPPNVDHIGDLPITVNISIRVTSVNNTGVLVIESTLSSDTNTDILINGSLNISTTTT